MFSTYANVKANDKFNDSDYSDIGSSFEPVSLQDVLKANLLRILALSHNLHAAILKDALEGEDKEHTSGFTEEACRTGELVPGMRKFRSVA